jgi:hypothetical protein
VFASSRQPHDPECHEAHAQDVGGGAQDCVGAHEVLLVALRFQPVNCYRLKRARQPSLLLTKPNFQPVAPLQGPPDASEVRVSDRDGDSRCAVASVKESAPSMLDTLQRRADNRPPFSFRRQFITGVVGRVLIVIVHRRTA